MRVRSTAQLLSCSGIVHASIVVYSYDFFFFQAEDGIRDLVRSRGLGDVYKRQALRRGDGHHWNGNRRRARDGRAQHSGGIVVEHHLSLIHI